MCVCAEEPSAVYTQKKKKSRQRWCDLTRELCSTQKYDKGATSTVFDQRVVLMADKNEQGFRLSVLADNQGAGVQVKDFMQQTLCRTAFIRHSKNIFSALRHFNRREAVERSHMSKELRISVFFCLDVLNQFLVMYLEQNPSGLRSRTHEHGFCDRVFPKKK